MGVNYHTLADFRVTDAERLDALFVHSVASLVAQGEVTLQRVAHDGVRVRASAGAGSYRGRGGLRKALAEAGTQVRRLRAELDDDPGATTRRQQAARARAAREREERVKAALEVLPELEAVKRRNGDDPETARASTTDHEARVMRMGDGGWRPAYNGQLTTDVGSGLVCGVSVTNRGSDAGELGPLVGRIERSFGIRPAEVLVDGGYATLSDIEALEACGTAVYAPPTAPRPRKEPTKEPRNRHPDTAGVAAWRSRMATPEAKAIYRERAASAEWTNAQARSIDPPTPAGDRAGPLVALWARSPAAASARPRLGGLGPGSMSACPFPDLG